MGYPLNLNGAPAQAAADVDVFLKKLAKAFPDVPIVLEDERFTSVLAHRAMIDGGMKKMARRDKAIVDEISATIILNDYLQSKTFNICNYQYICTDIQCSVKYRKI